MDNFVEADNITEDKNISNTEVVRANKPLNWIYDWVKSIILALFVVIIILTFFVRIVNVDGDSMDDTLANSDKLLVTSFLYKPSNGDIVIISHGQHLDKPIVKRVIATEGQTLKLDFKSNKVYVDGKLLDEPYTSSPLKKGDAVIPEIIPKGKIFVMGDNRYYSLDSRYNEVGLIDTGDVIGKAQYKIFPFEHFRYIG